MYVGNRLISKTFSKNPLTYLVLYLYRVSEGCIKCETYHICKLQVWQVCVGVSVDDITTIISPLKWYKYPLCFLFSRKSKITCLLKRVIILPSTIITLTRWTRKSLELKDYISQIHKKGPHVEWKQIRGSIHKNRHQKYMQCVTGGKSAPCRKGQQ